MVEKEIETTNKKPRLKRSCFFRIAIWFDMKLAIRLEFGEDLGTI